MSELPASHDQDQDQELCCDDDLIHPQQVALARAKQPDERSTSRLAELFKMLGDPTRIRIIAAVSTTELCVYDIAAVVGLSQSAISHQLRLLRAVGLVQARKAGKHVMYRLDDEHVAELFRGGLEHIAHR